MSRDANAVVAHAARWILPAYALLFLSFLSFLDPGGDPKIGLTGTVALIAWMFAESGRVVGIVVIATALLVVLVTRPGPSRRIRLVEVAVMIAVSMLILLGGSVLNDHVVKPAIGVARPDIVQLSDLGVLGIDVDSFYAMPKASRSEYLDRIKSDSGFGELVMRPEVRDHWVKETAFSMPSGHALAAMTFATFYLSMALSSLSGWRRWPFDALVPWAVCVCLSRPILRVHWPADIVIGGLAGILVGAGGFLLAHALLVRFERRRPRERPAARAARAV
jgi:phosphatidylglycerophosphatase B